jgi:DNA-binding winged helix-turn-helix (wHTH) protein/tetratricopeptide (TPR) repeat protein
MQRNSKENHSTPADAYRFAEFELIPSERQLRRRGKPVALPPKTFDALLILVRSAERLVRRDELIERLWPDTYVTDTNLTNTIVALRKVIGRDAIQTVSKFGYRFCLPVIGEPGIPAPTYASFLEAKALAAVRSLESMARARDLFAVCVAQDPTFAAAWAWLGRCARFLEKFTAGSAVNLDLADAAFRRALAIDPHLACAHHFYTQLQIDLGQSAAAAARLVDRILSRGDEPESYAGLVHALRFCGLLAQSVAAHDRAVALDPTVVTSVTHTHFLRCEYESAIDSYSGTRYYVDAAAWAALGDTTRAIELLRGRLSGGQLSALMAGLMNSLVATLEGPRDRAVALMTGLTVTREPEVLFYLARQCAMLDAVAESLEMLRRARSEGLTSSYALAHDDAFKRLRGAAFRRELDEARRVEMATRRLLERAGIGRLFKDDTSVRRLSNE